MLQHTLVEQLQFNAEAFPDRPALHVIGSSELTYRAALDRTLTLASIIRRHVDGSPAALLQRNGADSVLSILACQLAGVAAVPINPVLTPSEIEFILDDASVGIILHEDELGELVRGLSPDRRPAVVSTSTVHPSTEPWGSFTPSAPGDPFIIGYTSGTTGFPKGAVYDGEGMYVQYLRWALHFGLDADSTLLTGGPMFHNSYGGLSLLSLMLGATNRVMTSFDPAVACHELGEHCTFAFLVPSMLIQVLRAWDAAGRAPLTSLTTLLSSGAPVDPADLDAAFEAFPNAAICEAYGWSEGGWVTFERKQRGGVVAQCVGFPMVGADIGLFAEDGGPSPAGATGEIGVRNVTPFRGYINPSSPLETSADGRYLLSGDLGRHLGDGRLLVVDRKKDIIVTGGENVASGEVERVLAAHPSVRDVAVVGRPDARWGEAVTAVVVIAEDGDCIGDEELRAYCRERLAGYKTPKRFEFVEALPRNSMGKLQKFLLRQGVQG
jgi:acyl-CoA synthetase (AMP-forming)/AMP-acid ligase II